MLRADGFLTGCTPSRYIECIVGNGRPWAPAAERVPPHRGWSSSRLTARGEHHADSTGKSGAMAQACRGIPHGRWKYEKPYGEGDLPRPCQILRGFGRPRRSGKAENQIEEPLVGGLSGHIRRLVRTPTPHAPAPPHRRADWTGRNTFNDCDQPKARATAPVILEPMPRMTCPTCSVRRAPAAIRRTRAATSAHAALACEA